MYILKHLQGLESEELAAASKMEDGASFYQTTCPDVTKLLHIDPEEKRPTIVLLKKEAEKISHFGLFLSIIFWSLQVLLSNFQYIYWLSFIGG